MCFPRPEIKLRRTLAGVGTGSDLYHVAQCSDRGFSGLSEMKKAGLQPKCGRKPEKTDTHDMVIESTSSGGGSAPTSDDAATPHHHVVAIAAHHHTLGATGLTNPTGLFETGMARNVHIWVDGTDVSALVKDSSGNAGPWDGGGAEFDASEIDITKYIQSGGFHEIALSSSAIGGIKMSAYVFGLLKSF